MLNSSSDVQIFLGLRTCPYDPLALLTAWYDEVLCWYKLAFWGFLKRLVINQLYLFLMLCQSS